MRAAIKRAFRTRSKVTRKPVISITRVATKGKQTFRPKVVEKRPKRKR